MLQIEDFRAKTIICLCKTKNLTYLKTAICSHTFRSGGRKTEDIRDRTTICVRKTNQLTYLNTAKGPLTSRLKGRTANIRQTRFKKMQHLLYKPGSRNTTLPHVILSPSRQPRKLEFPRYNQSHSKGVRKHCTTSRGITSPGKTRLTIRPKSCERIAYLAHACPYLRHTAYFSLTISSLRNELHVKPEGKQQFISSTNGYAKEIKFPETLKSDQQDEGDGSHSHGRIHLRTGNLDKNFKYFNAIITFDTVK